MDFLSSATCLSFPTDHRRLCGVLALAMMATASMHAAPRMISYGYPNCISCHVSVQGRGLLNSYGRGIDSAQSLFPSDVTAGILGRAEASSSEPWNGRIGRLLPEFVLSSRFTERVDGGHTDPVYSALYRQVVFLGERDECRLNAEIGFRDPGLDEIRLGPQLTTTGGDGLFLKKLLFEWRLEENGSSGKELAIGRDYLPLGLQIDDDTQFILYLNRDGIYDFPLQAKFFAWDEKSLGSAYVFGPSGQEASGFREFGGGFLYERYPSNHLAVGMQGLAGFSDETNRFRIGAYTRWGFAPKWALLAQADYARYWNAGSLDQEGSQVTTYLQLFYHHKEWLVSSLGLNYAYSDLLESGPNFYAIKYSLAARLSRNFSVGISYAAGDILRSLGHAQEASAYATIKF
jgi:hypothetical protein